MAGSNCAWQPMRGSLKLELLPPAPPRRRTLVHPPEIGDEACAATPSAAVEFISASISPRETHPLEESLFAKSTHDSAGFARSPPCSEPAVPCRVCVLSVLRAALQAVQQASQRGGGAQECVTGRGDVACAGHEHVRIVLHGRAAISCTCMVLSQSSSACVAGVHTPAKKECGRHVVGTVVL